MKKTKTVEAYLAESGKWQEALILLREVMLSEKLEETVKWGFPVYSTPDNKNIAGIGAFKSYAGIWFFQGALLNDKKKELINAQKGVTKASRQWRFNSAEDIRKEMKTIREYVKEAVINQQKGKEIKPVKNKPLVIPDELKKLLISDPGLRRSFEAFTLSKKREFSEYISSAKRTNTKQKRLNKIKPLILRGEGLHDKYRKG